jgi:hypothetical protein
MFGYQCLRKSLSSGLPNSNKCPLCLAKWFRMSEDDLEELAEEWGDVNRTEEREKEKAIEAEVNVAAHLKHRMLIVNEGMSRVEATMRMRTLTVKEVLWTWVYSLFDIAAWLFMLFVAACTISCVLEMGVVEVIATYKRSFQGWWAVIF